MDGVIGTNIQTSGGGLSMSGAGLKMTGGGMTKKEIDNLSIGDMKKIIKRYNKLMGKVKVVKIGDRRKQPLKMSERKPTIGTYIGEKVMAPEEIKSKAISAIDFQLSKKKDELVEAERKVKQAIEGKKDIDAPLRSIIAGLPKEAAPKLTPRQRIALMSVDQRLKTLANYKDKFDKTFTLSPEELKKKKINFVVTRKDRVEENLAKAIEYYEEHGPKEEGEAPVVGEGRKKQKYAILVNGKGVATVLTKLAPILIPLIPEAVKGITKGVKWIGKKISGKGNRKRIAKYKGGSLKSALSRRIKRVISGVKKHGPKIFEVVKNVVRDNPNLLKGLVKDDHITNINKAIDVVDKAQSILKKGAKTPISKVRVAKPEGDNVGGSIKRITLKKS